MNNNIKQLLKDLKIDKQEIADLLKVSVPSVYRIINNPEQHQERIRKINSYIGELTGDGIPTAALDFDVEPDKVKKDTLNFNGKILTAHIVLNENPANMSLDEIREHYQLDEQKWTCVGYNVTNWNTTMKNSDNEPMVIQNYGIRANFKPVNDWMVTPKDIEWIKETLSAGSTKVKLTVQPEYHTGVLVLPLYDMHFGMYSWEEETHDGYSMQIAHDRYVTATACLIARAKLEGVTKAILPVGQDLIHVDNTNKSTTRGTPQDVDGQYKEIYSNALETMQEIIEICAEDMEVEAFYSPGNHDTLLSYTLVKALEGWYHNDERVTIVSNAAQRYYVRIGKNLIGFSHGNNEKRRLFDLMQSEARELWGLTEYSEWIVGHEHDEKVESKLGVRKRTIGSLGGRDLWTFNNGYLCSHMMQAPIYRTDIAGPYTLLHHNADNHELINGEAKVKELVK